MWKRGKTRLSQEEKNRQQEQRQYEIKNEWRTKPEPSKSYAEKIALLGMQATALSKVKNEGQRNEWTSDSANEWRSRRINELVDKEWINEWKSKWKKINE